MDAREALRRYLEQRRELGESELVLDSMSVDEVMKLLGAPQSRESEGAPERERGRSREREGKPPTSVPVIPIPAPPIVREPIATRETPVETSDWREALATPGDPALSSKTRTMGEAPAIPGIDAPGGLLVGAAKQLASGEMHAVPTIADLEKLIAACQKCPLYSTATNPVPGEGSVTADLVCVGEAPGATEDETGRPFIGAAGQLLTKILAAVNLPREEVYICNVLKHRPPGNRNPLPNEIQACSPYLMRQLELIRPKAILALGTFAAQTLLETNLPIGRLRGAVHRYYGTPLVVTYHPAALLRNPAWKRPTWEDVQLVRRILDNTAHA